MYKRQILNGAARNRARNSDIVSASGLVIYYELTGIARRAYKSAGAVIHTIIVIGGSR